MVAEQMFKRIDKYLFEIPRSFRPDMRIPARFYADQELLEGILGDRSLEQLVNTATLPGAVKYALAMPDIHQGYGFPIGGVVATELPDGVISPGGVGYDINCGVRLLGTHLEQEQVAPHLDELATALYANCPSGVGKGGNIRLKPGELDRGPGKRRQLGSETGYATETDLEHTEEKGCLRAPMPPRSAPGPRSAAKSGGNAGGRQPFYRSGSWWSGLRRNRRSAHGLCCGPGGRSDPLRFARPGASGLQRLCQGLSESHPPVRSEACRTASWSAPRSAARKARTTWRP